MKTYIKTLFLSGIALISFFACTGQNEVEQKQSEEVIDNIENSNWQFVDVRTPAEVERGYLKGTDHFFNYNDYRFEEQVKTLDKSRPVLLICRSGARSGRAAKLLKEKGFEEVYDLKGGLMRWRDPAYIVK